MASTEARAAAIRDKRQECGWTLDQLANKAGLSKSTVIRIERGKRVRRDSLKRVARALGLPDAVIAPCTGERAATDGSSRDEGFTRQPIRDPGGLAGRTEELGQLQIDIGKIGKHVLVFGPRGVGKTSLARVLEAKVNSGLCNGPDSLGRTRRFKAAYVQCESRFREMEDGGFATLLRDALVLLGRANGVREVLCRTVAGALATDTGEESVIIVDNVELLSHEAVDLLGELVQFVNNDGIEATFVFVGVDGSSTSMLLEFEPLIRLVGELEVSVLPESAIQEILDRGIRQNMMRADDTALEFGAWLSCGMPYFPHLIGEMVLDAAREVNLEWIQRRHVEDAIPGVFMEVKKRIRQEYGELGARVLECREAEARVLYAAAACQKREGRWFGYPDMMRELERLSPPKLDMSDVHHELDRFRNRHRALFEFRDKDRSYRFRDAQFEPLFLLRGWLLTDVDLFPSRGRSSTDGSKNADFIPEPPEQCPHCHKTATEVMEDDMDIHIHYCESDHSGYGAGE